MAKQKFMCSPWAAVGIFTLLLALASVSARSYAQVYGGPEERPLLARLMDSLEVDPDKTLKATENLYKARLSKQDSSGAAIAASQLAGFYNSLQDIEKMLATADLAKSLLPRKPSWEAAYRIALSQCRAAAKRGNSAEARRWVDSMEVLLIGINSRDHLQSYLLSDGITCVREGRLAEALEAIHKADSIGTDKDKPRQQEAIHMLAAVVYIAMGKVHESNQQIELAMALMDPATRPISRADRIEFLAHNKAREGQFDQALSLLDSAEHLLQQIQAPYNYIQFLATRADIFTLREDWEHGEMLFRDVAKRQRAIGIDPSYSLYWIGICNRGLDQYDTAYVYFTQAFEESVERENFQKASDYAFANYQSYLWKEKYKNALAWYEQHITYRDKVTSADVLLQQDLAASRYEVWRVKQLAETHAAQAALASNRVQLLASILLTILFVGVALFYRHRNQQQLRALEKVKADTERLLLDKELQQKNEQLNIQALTLAQKNSLLRSLEADLSALSTQESIPDSTKIQKLSRNIRNDLTESKDWEVFMNSLRQMHGSLFSALHKAHPNLTSNDHRLIAMLHLNMSSKEMARALSISEGGIKKARYRIRKKLGLSSSDSLQEYLLSLEAMVADA